MTILTLPPAVAEMPTAAEITGRLDAAAGPDRQPAADMADLAARLRALLSVQAQRQTRLQLGGGLFDVVITGANGAAEALERMDVQQGGCGPVIQDPAGWLYWLVPPGTSHRWAWHSYAVCLGAPHTLTVPPLNRSAPPGPFWLRPPRSDRLVPADPLRQALIQARPEPAPHRDLAARIGSTH
ncbi:hypothetical protein SAMN05216483_6774 [Streptomyces sp. 2131.1]|uniref:hypothetical protein n=1 Tax=Streptomyces sp. 2131.1 TaxID=1855346 RepID=UPI000898A849|nr:hypothetical protein [Streptomyces sp. 2131.1]SEE84812.1 hypothetical protein SAMN05216483_6774 [Streptomyces sp. 2131.1]